MNMNGLDWNVIEEDKMSQMTKIHFHLQSQDNPVHFAPHRLFLILKKALFLKWIKNIKILLITFTLQPLDLYFCNISSVMESKSPVT